MSGKAKTRRVGGAGKRPRGTRTEASGTFKGLPTIMLNDDLFGLRMMDERVATARGALFVMEEIVRQNFAGKERDLRLQWGFRVLAACDAAAARQAIREERAKC